MTFADVKKIVEKRISDIDVGYERDPGYEMCRDFAATGTIGRIEDFININIYECIKCLYYIRSNTGKSPQECSALLDSIRDYVETLDYKDYRDLFDSIFSFAQCPEKDNIVEYIREESEISAALKFRNIKFDTILSISKADFPDWEKKLNLKKIVKGFRGLQKKCNVAGVMDAVSEDTNTMGSTLSLIEVQKKMMEEKKKLGEYMDLLSYSSREKERAKLMNGFYKDYYKPRAIMGAVNSIRMFASDIEKDEVRFYKEIQRELHGLEVAMTMLEEALKHNEVTNARAIVRNIKDDEVKHAVLELIYEHNMTYYKQLEAKFNKLNNNSISSYISVLNKYGISVDANIAKKLMVNPIEDFEIIVAVVSTLDLSIEQFIKVLCVTNINVAKKIKDYLDKGYVNDSFLCAHLDLFNENSVAYKTLNDNVVVLNNCNINPALFEVTPEVLLTDSTCLSSNIALLDSYGLLKFIRTASSFAFIGDSSLAQKIDKFIELGYGSYLEQDLGLLNSNNIKRIEVLKAMNFEIDSLEDLDKVLSSSRFIVPDSMLDSYIPNVLPYKNRVTLEQDLAELEEYRDSKFCYSFGGVKISSNKVKRLVDSGSSLYDAIFSGVSVDEEDYNKIIHSLSFQK